MSAIRPAAIRRLRLTDFRNFRTLDLDVDARPVCLAGPNGSGKTNILEAISFLSPGRGLRSVDADEPLRRVGEDTSDSWAVFATVDGLENEVNIAAGLQPGGRRETRMNGKPAARRVLAETLPMIILLPEHDRLFAGPRAERLKFFDRMVSSLEPEHADALGAYEKLRSRRQRLLDQGRADASWLDALELDMAGHGVAVAAHRLKALTVLQGGIEAASEGVFPKAELALNGLIEARLSEGVEIHLAEDALIEALRSGRDRDAAAGRTLTPGPHRSDLTARHREKDQEASRCSTGEQKALLMRLVLSQALIMSRQSGCVPLLLLDEACAHFDEWRREGLADAILELGAQAWLTGVGAELFSRFGKSAQLFQVTEGEVHAA